MWIFHELLWFSGFIGSVSLRQNYCDKCLNICLHMRTVGTYVCLSTRKICSWVADEKVLVTFPVTIIYINGFHRRFKRYRVFCNNILIISLRYYTQHVSDTRWVYVTSCVCLLQKCAAGKRWGGQGILLLLLSLSFFNNTSKPGELRVSFGFGSIITSQDPMVGKAARKTRRRRKK